MPVVRAGHVTTARVEGSAAEADTLGTAISAGGEGGMVIGGEGREIIELVEFSYRAYGSGNKSNMAGTFVCMSD